MPKGRASQHRFASGIYEGYVSHCRFRPSRHRFRYRVFMMYLDLAEIDDVLAESRLWSTSRFSPASFRREDYLGDPREPLHDAVKRRVLEETGEYPAGAVRMLTNLRYFGVIINPITNYYCFNELGELQYIVAEVTNTPWRERHSYVIPAASGEAPTQATFSKNHHVSPFMPMDMIYHWRSNKPGVQLSVYMENHRQGRREFNAAMHLKRREITSAALNRILAAYPVMTLKVAWGIYWQALRLWWKKIPFHPHPRRRREAAVDESQVLASRSK